MAKRPHARGRGTGGAALFLAVASCARATPAPGSLVGPPTSTSPARPETAVVLAPATAPSGPLGAADDAPPPPPPAPHGIDFDALRRQPAPPSQAHTPPVHTATLGPTLRRKWVAAVGRTTFRTTMATAARPGGVAVVIGTHGATLGGQDEPSDGVYVLDGATGRVLTIIRPPGTGDLDVGGIALDGDTAYFGTDHGKVVAARLDGKILWTANLRGKVRPAPALADLDGDGRTDVVVGDEEGELVALDGATGRHLWLARTGVNAYGATGFIGAAALGDLDGDGRPDVVAGGRDGVLAAYRGRDGQVLWQVPHGSGMHASPSIADFDGNGTLEVLAAWSYSDVAVLEGATGSELWGQSVELDGAGIEGLFASPIPLPGASPTEPGVLVEGTAWWDRDDGIVGVGAFERAWKSFEGRVSASAVVGDLDDDGVPEAVVGTEKGKLVALRADGGYAVIGQLPGGIEASALIADVDGNGSYELLVASNDGNLSCFETGSRHAPTVARFRGNDAHNRGDLGVVRLGWRARPGAPVPRAGVAVAPPGVRVEYLTCCQALADAAVRAPAETGRLLLRASATCTSMAADGKSADEMRARVRGAVGQTLPRECR